MARVTFTELLRAEIERRTPDHPVYRLAKKTGGRNLVQMHGGRVPELVYFRPFDPYRGAAHHLRWPDQPPDAEAFVVKPIDASTCRGCVCLERVEGRLRSLWDDGTRTWREWRTWLNDQRLLAKSTSGAFRGPWIAEELIARRVDGELRGSFDWKCYVFGDRVAWVHQLERFGRRTSAAIAKHWAVEGDELRPSERPIIVQKREPGARLPPPRDPAALLACAGWLGASHQAETDSPFVRVDLYETEAGEPVFGEYTPQPSGGRQVYDPEWDERLGRLWLEAAG